MKQADTLNIRDARPGDRPAAQAVTLAAFAEYANAMAQPGWEYYRQDLWDTVGNPAPAEHIIAEQNGRIVGSVLLFPPTAEQAEPGSDAPRVRVLAVAPDVRGYGIGRALMEECAQRARAAGFRYLTLHTAEHMQIAMHLYQRIGFVRAPELDAWPLEGVLIKGYRLDLAA